MHQLTDPPDNASKIGEPGVLDARMRRELSPLRVWSLADCEPGCRRVALCDARSGIVEAVE